MHAIIPEVRKGGRLEDYQEMYNAGHQVARAVAEHQFTCIHNFSLITETWRNLDRLDVLQNAANVVFNLVQFVNRRKLRRKPHGPWNYLPDQPQGSTPSKQATASNQPTTSGALSGHNASSSERTAPSDEEEEPA